MDSQNQIKNMSSSVSSKVDCNICAGEVTQRKILKCPFCSFEACRSCVEKFLMGIDDDKPRCMDNSCKKVWNGDFMSDNFMPSFYNNKYLNRRAAILHEREKSLLPGTQGLVKQEENNEKKRKKIDDLQNEINMHKELIKSAQTKIRNLICTPCHIEKKKGCTFTRACPVDDCRGFLSARLKCGICSTYACVECHLPKFSKYEDGLTLLVQGLNYCVQITDVQKFFSGCGNILECRIPIDKKGMAFVTMENNSGIEKGLELDGSDMLGRYVGIKVATKNDNEHKCDPDLVATVKLLSKDTKSCPACATPIHKIHGCDQMYCTQCHTAFSWNKGTIERGVVHNPHFYEFQRAQNGGVAPRNRGDVRCGDLPRAWEIQSKLLGVGIARMDFDCRNPHMLIGHINQIELQFYPNRLGDMDNSILRRDYLMKRIDEKQFISKLKARMKKQEKDVEFNMVLTMFTSTLSDLLVNIITTNISEDIYKFINSINELRVYTNNALKKIGIRYGNIYPGISEDFEFYRNARFAPSKRT